MDDYLHGAVVQRDDAWDNRFFPDTRHAKLLGDDLNPADLWAGKINPAARRQLTELFLISTISNGMIQLTKNEKWAFASTLLTGLAGLVSGYALLGKVASAAPLLTLFFTGVATGASLSLFLRKIKQQADKKSPTDSY